MGSPFAPPAMAVSHSDVRQRAAGWRERNGAGVRRTREERHGQGGGEQLRPEDHHRRSRGGPTGYAEWATAYSGASYK